MLDDLIAQKHGADEEAFFGLHSVQITGTGLLIKLSLDPADGSERLTWQIDCVGVREFLLRTLSFDSLRVESVHPILLTFNELFAELYFYSSPTNPSELIGELFEGHKELVDDWIPFERFLSQQPGGLPKILSAQSGMLASGPQSIIRKYAGILTRHTVAHSVRSTQMPKVWDGEKWIQPDLMPQALILDNSYVVAESFDAQRL